MKEVLSINNLSKKFSEFHLKDVSFSVYEGEIMGFIGPNGAGKTTTIKLMLNVLFPDSGTVKYWGSEIHQKSETADERIGVVMDQTFLLGSWSVEQSEKIVKKFYTNWSSQRFSELIGKFGISKEKKIKELSKGMIMKLQIAIALSYGASFLILDEPTSGLDPVAREELMDILSDFVSNGQNSVFFSTHITTDLEKIAETITFIENGEIKYSGKKETLLNEYMVVSGASNQLTPEISGKLIGLKDKKGLFNGIVKKEDLEGIPEDLCSVATIDDIVVCFYKEDMINE